MKGWGSGIRLQGGGVMVSGRKGWDSGVRK